MTVQTGDNRHVALQVYSPSGAYLTTHNAVHDSAFVAQFAYSELPNGNYVVNGIAPLTEPVPSIPIFRVYSPDDTAVSPVVRFAAPYGPYGVLTNWNVDGGVFLLAYSSPRSYLRFDSTGAIGSYQPVLPYGAYGALTNAAHVILYVETVNSTTIFREYDANDAAVGSALEINTANGFALSRSGDILSFNGDGTARLYAQPRCGDAIVDAGLGEQCDDGNTTDLDGCSSSCLEQVCGNSTVDPGEGCDDGNVVGGDGCDDQCRLEDHVSTVADPGAPVGTDDEGDGATPGDPLEVSLTSPSGGAVTLTEDPFAGSGAYGVLGQQVVITAPEETAANPLVIALRVDASLIPHGTSASEIQIFRNDVLVADCADTSGQANPDPCVASRVVQADGDVVVTALSSHASTWYLATVCGDGAVCAGPECSSGPAHGREFCDLGDANSDTTPDTCRSDCSLPHCGDHVIDSGETCDDGNTVDNDGCSAGCRAERVQSKEQAAWITKVGKAANGGINARMKLLTSCVVAAERSGDDPAACLASDAGGKLTSAAAKFDKAVVSSCSQAPDFGVIGGNGGDAIGGDDDHLLADLFGDAAASVMLRDSQCQSAVTKVLAKVVKTSLGLFSSCIKQALATIDTGAGLASCVAAHDHPKLSGLVEKIAGVREKKCSGVTLSTAFPGECAGQSGMAFDQCVTSAALCQACTSLEHIYGFGTDCDQLDDGTLNSSCPG